MNCRKTEYAQSSRSTRLTDFAAIVCAAFIAFPCASIAQSLDDWKAAKSAADSGKGAESIPYSSLRTDVENQRSAVSDCAKEEEECKGTKAIRADINGIQAKLDEMKKEMERMTKVLEEKKQNLQSDLESIDKRITARTKCLEARTAVHIAFNNAINKANNESDADIKPIASFLISYWEKKQPGHEKQINDVRNSIERCQRCKDGNE